MGGIEIVAALLGVINIVLVVRRSIWNYPFGIAMVALYFFVFWDAKLYSDGLLQIFFLVIQVYGWWIWVRSPQVDHGVAVEWMTVSQRIRWIIVTSVFALAWGFGMASYTDAAAPFADAIVAGLSVAAQILQSRRRVECWVLWVTVDAFAVGLYLWRGLDVTAALYTLFFVLAVIGLREWARKAKA